MAEQTPDSIITTQRNGQTIVAELFFNHSSTETFRIIAKNPSHENAASKLVPAAVRFFILAVLIRFKQHSAPPYETTFLPFFSLPLSARRCAMI